MIISAKFIATKQVNRTDELHKFNKTVRELTEEIETKIRKLRDFSDNISSHPNYYIKTKDFGLDETTIEITTTEVIISVE